MEEKSTLKIKVVFGLGNPGKDYESAYHSAGVSFINFLAGDLSFENPSGKHFAYAKKGNLILAKSLVFMNQSGTAVKEILKFFKIKPENLLIIHDDSDMTLGNFKISFNQSSGGHKGVQSVINYLKTKEFWRLKIGIRPVSEEVRQKAEKFVLKKISKKDGIILEKTFREILEKIPPIFPT